MHPTDLNDIPLETDLEVFTARLDRTCPEPRAAFVLPQNRFLVHKRKAEEKAARRGIRKLIRPENAAIVIQHLPGPGERTHCVLRGDFVLCDLIPGIIGARGRCPHLRIATLGLSTANADTLASLVESGEVHALTVVVSHYFQQVDKTTTYREVAARLQSCGGRLVVTRSHAKVICLPGPTSALVIEGSANLRSSDNLEQMCIIDDPETHDFHASWIDELAAGTEAA